MYIDHNQLDDPLPFKIMKPNIVVLLKLVVYMILKGKGWLCLWFT